MIYRYIYKITCTVGTFKGKFYFGQHTTNNLNDNYHGSSSILKQAKYFKKHPNDYIKDILYFCNSQEELDNKEKYIISKYIDHKDCLNIAIGGINCVGIDPTYKMSEEQYKQYCKNISEGLKGHKGCNPFVNMTEEQYKKHCIQNGLRFKGIPKTEEQKKKQHDKMVGKLAGEKNPNYGISPKERMDENTYNNWKLHIKLSNRSGEPEIREKISKANKGKTRTKEQKDNYRKLGKERWNNQNFRDKMINSMKTITGPKLSIMFSGEGNPNYGKRGTNSYLYGRKWMNDNINEYIVESKYWGEFIDIGYFFGRLSN